MLDNADNTILLEASPILDFESLSSDFDALLPSYSVRTNNILQALMEKFPNKLSFLEAFTQMTSKEIALLRNCGRKSLEEILAIQTSLNSNHMEQNTEIQDSVPRALPSNIDSLLPLVMPRLEGLSVRAKNGFIIFLEEHHNSLSEIYATVTTPKFNPVKMKNVGRSTAEEVMGLINSITAFLESFSDERAVEEALTVFSTRTLEDLHVPAEAQEKIRDLETSLGYFPLFASIKAYLEGLEGDDRAIIDGCIITREDQPHQDRSKVATSVGLSLERVRQKQKKMIASLSRYFETYRTFGFVDKCPYNYQMRRVNEDINAIEGTSFTLNFVNWVLASTFKEITLIGDVVKTLTGYYDKHFFICLAPTDLCQYMDFAAFIEDVDAHIAEKRINEEKVSLQSLINSHLKTQYCEDEMPAIEIACRSILFLHFPVEVDFGQVIFKPNTRKNNPIVVEEIIRSAGRPLTLEEIHEEFVYQYPERYTEITSLRGSINKNPNIIPISRTSTYSLVEWEGENIRGGSIRQIVVDFLREHEPTIASLSEISEFVCQFRPTTDQYSILTNLILDKSGQFAFFFKNGVKFIGLSGSTYPVEFFPYSGDARNATAMSVGYPKLLAFVSEKGRFPFSSGVDDDEKQLCNFWRRQQHYYESGELSSSGLEYHIHILNDYGHLQMDKREFEWRRKYDILWQSCFGEESPNMDEEDKKELNSFTDKMLHDYNYCIAKVPQWKREAIEKFMHRLRESSHVQDNLG